MSEKFTKKITLSRRDAAVWMIAIGEGLAASGETTFELGGEGITASVPDELTFELEIKETELEIELKWERTPSGKPNDQASNESSTLPRDPGEQAAATADRHRFAQWRPRNGRLRYGRERAPTRGLSTLLLLALSSSPLSRPASLFTCSRCGAADQSYAALGVSAAKEPYLISAPLL